MMILKIYYDEVGIFLFSSNALNVRTIYCIYSSRIVLKKVLEGDFLLLFFETSV